MAGAPTLSESRSSDRRTNAGEFIAKQEFAVCGMARERKTTQNRLGTAGLGANCSRELVARVHIPVA
jgi:hypothetical protein